MMHRTRPVKFGPLKPGLQALLVISACVTCNVYFPAAAAENAADRIIEDVWGADGKSVKKTSGTNPQSSLYQQGGRLLLATAGQALNFIIPSIVAQSAELNMATPAIRQITRSIAEASIHPEWESDVIPLQ